MRILSKFIFLIVLSVSMASCSFGSDSNTARTNLSDKDKIIQKLVEKENFIGIFERRDELEEFSEKNSTRSDRRTLDYAIPIF